MRYIEIANRFLMAEKIRKTGRVIETHLHIITRQMRAATYAKSKDNNPSYLISKWIKYEDFDVEIPLFGQIGNRGRTM